MHAEFQALFLWRRNPAAVRSTGAFPGFPPCSPAKNRPARNKRRLAPGWYCAQFHFTLYVTDGNSERNQSQAALAARPAQ
jgi:hypothetical protein